MYAFESCNNGKPELIPHSFLMLQILLVARKFTTFKYHIPHSDSSFHRYELRFFGKFILEFNGVALNRIINNFTSVPKRRQGNQITKPKIRKNSDWNNKIEYQPLSFSSEKSSPPNYTNHSS